MKGLLTYAVVYTVGLLLGQLLTDHDSYHAGILVGATSALAASFFADIVRELS